MTEVSYKPIIIKLIICIAEVDTLSVQWKHLVWIVVLFCTFTVISRLEYWLFSKGLYSKQIKVNVILPECFFYYCGFITMNLSIIFFLI